MIIYLLYAETSDRLGTSDVIGAYSTLEKAREIEGLVKNRRTYIKEFNVDQIPDRKEIIKIV